MKTLLTLAALALAPVAFAANPVVEMKTSAGTIKIELFEKEAPGTVKNFLQYAEDKHYDGTTYHRVISKFMIQGGGYTKDGELKKTRASIKNESTNGLKNVRGTLAMARTSEADSATSQFFINVVDNDFLDRENARDGVGYCVFGKVLSGMDVVDKIRAVKTGAMDRPLETVTIESVKVVKE